MKFETKARPITSAAELDAALAAGAQVEFTACGNSYDAPRWPERGSGGWIDVDSDDARGAIDGLSHFDRLRAFYPLATTEIAA